MNKIYLVILILVIAIISWLIGVSMAVVKPSYYDCLKLESGANKACLQHYGYWK